MGETEKITRSVLIAEDEDAELEALSSKFELAGFRVSRAKDGKEALRKAVDEQPDLVLLDVLMPEMNGWEVMKGIRAAEDWGKEVPIIILTNTEVDTDEKQIQILRDEPAYFLVKTEVTADEVVQRAMEVLG